MIFREDYNDEKNLFVLLLCICLMVRLVMAEENSEAILGIWEGHSTSEMTVRITTGNTRPTAPMSTISKRATNEYLPTTR